MEVHGHAQWAVQRLPAVLAAGFPSDGFLIGPGGCAEDAAVSEDAIELVRGNGERGEAERHALLELSASQRRATTSSGVEP